MSRSQFVYPPATAGSSRSGSRAANMGRAADTRRELPVSFVPPNEGGTFVGFAPVKTLDDVKKAFTYIFGSMSMELAKCSLTPAEEILRQEFYGDIQTIRDLLLAVLEAHHEVSNTARNMIYFPPVPPEPTPRLEDMLQPARVSIQTAQSKLANLSHRLRERCTGLRDEVQYGLPEGSMKAFCNWVASYKGGHVLGGLSGVSGLSAAIYEPADLGRLGNQVTGAVVAKSTLTIASALFGLGGGAVLYHGRHAHIYNPTARTNTTEALDEINDLLLAFSRVLGCLESYWRTTHRRQLDTNQISNDAAGLLRIADTLDQHVDDCLEMAAAIQLNIPVRGASRLPSPADLQQQRHPQYSGVLPTYTRGGY